MNKAISYSIKVIIVLCLLPWSARAAQQPPVGYPECNLDVSFDISASKITGVMKIDAHAGTELVIDAGEMKILGLRVDGKKTEFIGENKPIKMTPAADTVVEISYEGVFVNSKDNVIDNRGILLSGTWYPSVEGFCQYRLKAVLPEGFEAVSEAERVEKRALEKRVELRFDFPHPLHDRDGITFIASHRYVVFREKYRDVELSAYFFKEDARLAPRYLAAVKRYLAEHEEHLTRFPYRRFAVVESFLPSAFSMPTLILMSRDELLLPSVELTALRHELVHQWFGNSVFTDYDSGNWNEGLTIYFADHFYQERNGRGWQCRRRILSGFQSYISEKDDFPLTGFSERNDDASRMIGYGKSAMVAHMLRKLSGDRLFHAAIRDFIEQNAFAVASWDELRIAFEKRLQRALKPFFAQWLDGTGMPDLELEDIQVSKAGQRYLVSFAVEQKTAPYRMSIPVGIYYNGGVRKELLMVDQVVSRYSFTVPGEPHEVALDEDYDVFRALLPEENPPTFERLLTDDNIVIVPPSTSGGAFRDVIEAFSAEGAVLKRFGYRSGYNRQAAPEHRDRAGPEGRRGKGFFARERDELSDDDLENASLVILGSDNPVATRLFGRRVGAGKTFSVTMRRNPLNPRKVAAIVDNPGRVKAGGYVATMASYPFYSRYALTKDGRLDKSLDANERGIRITLQQ